jgi:hypothetical protein
MWDWFVKKTLIEQMMLLALGVVLAVALFQCIISPIVRAGADPVSSALAAPRK